MAKRQDSRTEMRINAVLVMMAIWMGAGLIAIWAWALRASPEVGLSNRDMALGWQGVALIFAFAIWAVALGLPTGHGIRRISLFPLAATVAACAMLLLLR